MKKINPLLVIILGVLISIFFYLSKSEKHEIRAKVLEISNEEVISSGVGRLGRQILTIKFLSGSHKGEVINATNHLTGSMEIDNFYNTGEIILAAIQEQEGKIKDVQAIDLYRWPSEMGLLLIFIISLVIYAGSVGIRALISFLASVLIIWHILIKGVLAGYSPFILTFLVLIILSAVILFSIAGFNRKGLAAFLGTLAGLMVTALLSRFFGPEMGLDGMTAPFAQTLLFKGYININMQEIFFCSIILGASGAAMDIAMDISASIDEIHKKRPDISLKELTHSGFTIGRAVIGTMTTTLLLAYSGGYITLLMLFSSQEANFSRMINFKLVSAEVLRILSGSIGLVLVAPLTAVIAAWIMTRGDKV